MVSGEVCFSGSLPEKPDQDLWLWDVLPQDGLSTWTFSITGVPNATTSVHVIRITSPPGVFPVTTAGDAARVDSELDGITRGRPAGHPAAGRSLPPGRLTGGSRGWQGDHR